ncbi:hypothetical protein WJX84_005606 [Apatococcus fuscideae]|uniref:Peptidase M20 dimerisation domain-containing protein n=1 Tax=Apatococcus fuscideae TaxID=2026836 RepID=A0AAW1T2H7_9CHLO
MMDQRRCPSSLAPSMEILDGTLIKGKRKVDAFVELHIEQGPRLEAEGAAIGVVQAIAAPAAMRVSFHGDGGHAGAQLMPLRNDASLAAAELALQVEAAVLATGAPDTVGTVGRWDLSPNTVNSVPREAALEIDIRDIDGSRRDKVVTTITEAAAAIAKRRKVRHDVAMVNQDAPATCGPEVTSAIAASVEELGLSSIKLVSRAYHDALFMAQIGPAGMIFIPCRNGWSHRPDEFSSPEAIENGVKVLALTLARLASAQPVTDKKEL